MPNAIILKRLCAKELFKRWEYNNKQVKIVFFNLTRQLDNMI